ncbi:MAG: alpha/beta hydrolase family protein [Pseudomonas sp.]|uniref:alpha/beta hydrolase family protein n=1 Tax=Pseudomonas sp. TaxID=306 RepID=UPI003392C7CF
MPRPLGSTQALLCLALLLPLSLPVLGEDAPVANTPTAPPAAETAAEPAAQTPAPSEGEGAATATPRETPGERSEAEAVALERQLPVGEQQQLKAATESFLALWQPANVGEPSGLVILLPGDGETADWPQAISPLRHKLPNAGWHSLSLSLPDPKEPPPPPVPALAVHVLPASAEAETAGATPEGAEAGAASAPAPTAPEAATPAEGTEAAATTPADAAASEPEASAVPTPAPLLTPEEQNKVHAERVLARIEAAIAFAEQQQAKRIVLLGHGSGAYWAARYLAERKPAQVKNLLMVGASLPVGFSPPLEELVPALQLPTGDFYYKDQAQDRNAALRRAQAGKRQKHPAYIQVAMKALPGNPAAEQEQLYRRIRGWLTLQITGATSP